MEACFLTSGSKDDLFVSLKHGSIYITDSQIENKRDYFYNLKRLPLHVFVNSEIKFASLYDHTNKSTQLDSASNSIWQQLQIYQVLSRATKLISLELLAVYIIFQWIVFFSGFWRTFLKCVEND